jgi:RimJ/RimL family protein N-acetyltransferase
MLSEKNQEKGLGLKSYQPILDFLHDKKIESIQLAVVETNISAMAFWTKLGFKLNGRTGQYNGIKIQKQSNRFRKANY